MRVMCGRGAGLLAITWRGAQARGCSMDKQVPLSMSLLIRRDVVLLLGDWVQYLVNLARLRNTENVLYGGSKRRLKGSQYIQ